MIGAMGQLGRRGLLAMLGALTLGVAATGAAAAWPQVVEGRPPDFGPGSRSGYYIWHLEYQRPHWTLATTNPDGVSRNYTGTLTTNGSFVQVAPLRLELADRIRLVGDNVLQFNFDTHSQIDGVGFSIEGGSHLTFALEIDGRPAPPRVINLGRTGAPPPSNPFTLTR